jgi:tRNA-dihydrouridine synthase A
MMEWTDRHCRYFLRQISRRRLYNEMVPPRRCWRPESYWLPANTPGLQPAAPCELAAAPASRGLGYDEINVNWVPQ